MASVTITQLTDQVTVENPGQTPVNVSGATQFPITIEYNATIIEGGGMSDNGLPPGGLAGQILTKVDDTNYAAIWADAPQGFSGDYNDLSNTPDLSVYQLSSSAFSGSYNDLTDTPTIPDVSAFITKVEDDTAPKLGGNLNVTGRTIFTTSGTLNLNSSNEVSINNGALLISADISQGSTITSANQTAIGYQLGNGGYLTFENNRANFGNAFNLARSYVELNTGRFVGPVTGALTTTSIVSTSNGNIVINPDGTGRIILDGQSFPAADGQAGQALVTDGQGNLSWQTLLNPTPGGSSIGLTAIEQDSNPKLGGDLDVNNNKITNYATNGNVVIETNGSGRLVVNGLALPNTDGQPGQVLKTDGQGNLDWADDDDTITTVSEAQPQVAVVGEQWFNPTTKILKVYTAAGWVQVTADDLQF